MSTDIPEHQRNDDYASGYDPEAAVLVDTDLPISGAGNQRGPTSYKKASGVSSSDAADEDDNNDIQEDLAEAVILDGQGLLETEEGLNDLNESIDGKTKEERTLKEEEAIDLTNEQLVEDETLDMDVEVADADGSCTIVCEDGEEITVQLEEGEKSTVVETDDGEKVLVLADGLSAEETIVETVEAIANEVEEVARENGVNVIPEELRLFLSDVSIEAAINYVTGLIIPSAAHNLLLDKFEQGLQGDPSQRH